MPLAGVPSAGAGDRGASIRTVPVAEDRSQAAAILLSCARRSMPLRDHDFSYGLLARRAGLDDALSRA